MRSIKILACLALLAASAFAQTAAQRSEIEAQVLAVMSKQSAAWNLGDIEGFMQGYWNSEKLVFASGDRITHGWQPTLENYKKTYGAKGMMGELTFSDLEVNVLSKDHAVVLGSWSLKREKDNPKGKFTLIFNRTKDGWRIIHDHTS